MTEREREGACVSGCTEVINKYLHPLEDTELIWGFRIGRCGGRVDFSGSGCCRGSGRETGFVSNDAGG